MDRVLRIILSNSNGVIASVAAEVDENVSPGQTIGVLNAGTSIEISLGLPESVINAVKKDMEVTVTFPAIQGVLFQAVITEVAPAVDVNTSTYPVTVMIIDKDDRIKSGMASNVQFEFVVLMHTVARYGINDTLSDLLPVCRIR